MSNEFIRKCWNERLSKEQFVQKAKEEFHDENYKLLIQNLLTLCGYANSSTELLNYMYQIFIDDIVLATNCIDLKRILVTNSIDINR